MHNNTSDKIIQYIKNKKYARANELVDYLNISRQALYKHLAKLLKQSKIRKTGKPPKIFYLIINKQQISPITYSIKEKIKNKIDKHFLIITPLGEQKIGWPGFVYWCEKNNLAVEKTAGEYIKTLKKYDAFRKQGLINGLGKLKNTFIVNEPGVYQNILLIDDAVGSGATLNEVAKQIKDKKIAKKVIGLSITGSFKGFDVISEV